VRHAVHRDLARPDLKMPDAHSRKERLMLRRGDPRILLLLVTLAGGAPAAEIPRTGSPGGPSYPTQISRSCPTFTWEQVEGAVAYDLVVYRLLDGDEGSELVLDRAFAGPVDSWTPSLDDCLERGGRYAWSVRVVAPGEPSAWSAPSLFRVVGGPDLGELEETLERATIYLQARKSAAQAHRAPAEGEPAARRRPAAEAPGSGPAPRAVAATGLSVDGGVEAISLTGDGSTLTSLAPSNLSPGTAGISVTGSSGSLSCVGCISSIDIGTGQVKSADIGDGEVTGADIDPSSVQARIGGSCGADTGIRAVGGDGSTTCGETTSVHRGDVYGVGVDYSHTSAAVTASRDNRLCFLDLVEFADVDGGTEDAWCLVELPQADTWRLEAVGEGDSEARCGMRCMRIDPTSRTF
jgi:hypothetical protein